MKITTLLLSTLLLTTSFSSVAAQDKSKSADIQKARIATSVIRTDLQVLELMITQCAEVDQKVGLNIAGQYKKWQSQQFTLFRQITQFEKVWLQIISNNDNFNDEQRQRMLNREKAHINQQLDSAEVRFQQAAPEARVQTCNRLDRDFAQIQEQYLQRRNDLYQHLINIQL